MNPVHNPDLYRKDAKALQKPMITRHPASKPPSFYLHTSAPPIATCPELLPGSVESQGGSPIAGKLLLEEEGEAGPLTSR